MVLIRKPKISLKGILELIIALMIFLYINSLINSNNFINKPMNQMIIHKSPIIHLRQLKSRRELGNLMQSMNGKKMIEVNYL